MLWWLRFILCAQLQAWTAPICCCWCHLYSVWPTAVRADAVCSLLCNAVICSASAMFLLESYRDISGNFHLGMTLIFTIDSNYFQCVWNKQNHSLLITALHILYIYIHICWGIAVFCIHMFWGVKDSHFWTRPWWIVSSDSHDTAALAAA